MTLVTGANGFLGLALCDALRAGGRPVRRATRRPVAGSDVAVGDIGPATDWMPALEEIDTIVHTAARVHVMAAPDATDFWTINVEGTRRLAEQAAQAGVRRLVFVSSVKVNGESTAEGARFTHADLPQPGDAYAASKWAAEQALHEVAAGTDLDVTIVRPPLIYGKGVRANFQRLIRWVRKGLPLPFGAVDNRRSLVGRDNLVDLLILCLDHPAAAGQTFLVSDGDDLSTPGLIRRLAGALGQPARLFPVPADLLRFAGRISGHLAEVERLIGSLQVDMAHTRDTLDWRPPMSVDEGLRRTVVS